MPPLFSIGDIVKVDNTDRGYIIELRGKKHDLFLKIKYIINNKIETNVSQHRCKVISIDEINNSTRSGRIQRYSEVRNLPSQPPSQPIIYQQRRTPFKILKDTVNKRMDVIYRWSVEEPPFFKLPKK